MGFDAPDTDQGAARRRQILDAARREFLAHGFSASSLRTIARQSDCAVANLYGYYPSKDALFCAVTEATHTGLGVLLEKTMRREIELSNNRELGVTVVIEKMIAMGEEILDYTFANYDDMRLLLTRATGSSREHYIEDFTKHFVEITREYLAVNPVVGSAEILSASTDLTDLIATLPLRYLEKVVDSDISREQARIDYSVLVNFQLHGYNAITHWWDK